MGEQEEPFAKRRIHLGEDPAGPSQCAIQAGPPTRKQQSRRMLSRMSIGTKIGSQARLGSIKKSVSAHGSKKAKPPSEPRSNEKKALAVRH